jgi:hypothetical protein
MKLSQFCYPYKDVMLDFLLQIYLDTEKEIPEDYHDPLWEVIDCVFDDLKKFIEVRINLLKGPGERKPRKSQADIIDLTKKFNIRDCFSSKPMLKIFEDYIYGTVIPALAYFFELRLRVTEKVAPTVRNIIRLVVEATRHIPQGNLTYVRNINRLQKAFMKIPQLKEIVDGLKNTSVSMLAEPRPSSINVTDHA